VAEMDGGLDGVAVQAVGGHLSIGRHNLPFRCLSEPKIDDNFWTEP